MSISSLFSKQSGESLAQKKSYLPFIDGLRGIAVLMVVFAHTSEDLEPGPWGVGPWHYPFSFHIAQAGNCGVQLFFIISAFTLFSSSFVRFKKDQYPAPMFYIRRFFRIWPFWAVIVAFWAITYRHTLLQAFLSLSFLFGFVRFNGAYEIVPGGWTLFVEETFYVFLPLIFAWVTGFRKAVWFFLGLLILSQAWIIYGPLVKPFQAGNFIFFAPMSQWFAFGLGIVAFYTVKSEWFKQFNSRSNYAIANALALLAFAWFITAEYRLATLSLFGVLLVASLDGGLLKKLTNTRILMMFGKYCYSIYLLQFLVLTYFSKINIRLFTAIGLQGHSNEARMLVAFPLICLACLAMASVSYRLIERPCVLLGRRLAERLNYLDFGLPKWLPGFIWSPKR